jgi:hypothetical protein
MHIQTNYSTSPPSDISPWVYVCIVQYLFASVFGIGEGHSSSLLAAAEKMFKQIFSTVQANKSGIFFNVP